MSFGWVESQLCELESQAGFWSSSNPGTCVQVPIWWNIFSTTGSLKPRSVSRKYLAFNKFFFLNKLMSCLEGNLGWKQIYLINSQNIILNCNQMFQCLHKEMSFHFLPFHMWPGVHVYVMWWSVIDYNTGETLNKPTDIFGQVAHSLDLYFIVFYFLVVENMFE